MNQHRCTVRLEFNSFYIAGSHDVDVPALARGATFAANRDCINVGCRMWQDAETEITLGRHGKIERGDGHVERLDWSIATPSRQVLLFDANHPQLIRLPIATKSTRIRVWTNHATEPDRVAVIVGG